MAEISLDVVSVRGVRVLRVTVCGLYELSKNIENPVGFIKRFHEEECAACILDYRQAEIKVDLISTIQRDQVYREFNLDPKVKIAGVWNRIGQDVHFIETALRNRGWQVKMFNSMEDAERHVSPKELVR